MADRLIIIPQRAPAVVKIMRWYHWLFVIVLITIGIRYIFSSNAFIPKRIYQPSPQERAFDRKAICVGKPQYKTRWACEDNGGVWDAQCETDNDCPYFASNRNYPDSASRGRCIRGRCECPQGTTRKGFRGCEGKPLCYNCNFGLRGPGTLGRCCDEQLRKTEWLRKQKKNKSTNTITYPDRYLITPDYAFPGDEKYRSKFRGMFIRRVLTEKKERNLNPESKQDYKFDIQFALGPIIKDFRNEFPPPETNDQPSRHFLSRTKGFKKDYPNYSRLSLTKPT